MRRDFIFSGRTRRAVRRALLAVGCACAALTGIAWAGDALLVKEAFTPDRLGAAANLSITASFARSGSKQTQRSRTGRAVSTTRTWRAT